MSDHEIPVSDDFWAQLVTQHMPAKPPNSKTTRQLASEKDIPIHTARGVLERAVKAGELERIKIGKEVYYYPPNNVSKS